MKLIVRQSHYFALAILLSLGLTSGLAFAGAHDVSETMAAPNLADGDFMPGLARTETEKIADGLYTFRWEAYRSIFMVTDEGVIVTDPISVKAAKRYREEIAKITDQPVKYVVYSHSHWDHIVGGQIFKDEGATFIAQEECVENMKWSPHPDVVLPDITFKDSYTVELGNQKLGLHYFGPSHDTCLIVMNPKPQNHLFTVDIVTPPTGNYFPWDPQVADFHFYNAVQFLEQVEALAEQENITTLIGAHLKPVPKPGGGGLTGLPSTGPISAVKERRIFWDTLIKAVKAEMDKGTLSFMVSGRIDKTEFEKIPGYKEKDFKLLVNRVAAYHAIGR